MITHEQEALISAGLQTSETYAEIAERCGVDPWTVSNYVRRHKIKRQKERKWPSVRATMYLELRGIGIGPTETGDVLGASAQTVSTCMKTSGIAVEIGELLDEDVRFYKK